jgi:hypothetical protein
MDLTFRGTLWPPQKDVETMHKQTLSLQEEDLQEVFALFSSPTYDELRQIYDESSRKPELIQLA